MSENLKRLILFGGIVLALAAAGVFLLWEPKPELEPVAATEVKQEEALPAAGSLTSSAGEIERSTVPSEADAVALAGAAAATAVEPKGWFRGQLHIVKGELPTAPRLSATVSPYGDSLSGQVSVAVDARTLAFAIPAEHPRASCELLLPSFLIPVGIHGAAEIGDQSIRFAAPAEGVTVDVEVKPHAGVLFLHDPSGLPLANADAWTELRDGQGSSTSWGEKLDADGMLYFDFERLMDFDTAQTITFSVARPPDVGNSSSPDFDTKDLALMAQPIVLRFASSQQLHFLVVDFAGNPVPNATLRVGGRDASAVTGADGKVTALQSIPPADNLEAEAPGFVPAWHAISPAAASEQLIVMAPASWIELVGLEQPPGGWNELDAEFNYDGKADASSLIGERFQPGRVRESAGGSSSSNNRTDLRFLIRTSFSNDGRVLLDGIHADVPATVTVSYHGQPFLTQRVPLQPGDGAHRIELPPLPEFVPLRGRVVDAGGAPLAGVRVRANYGTGDHSMSSSETNALGEFNLGMIQVGATVQLGFTKVGLGLHRMDFTGRDGDAQSVGTVTMGAGRTLLVVVTTDAGSTFIPVAGTEGVGTRPEIRFFGEYVAPSAQGAGPSEWLFTDIPTGELHFVLLNRGGKELQEWTITSSEARIVLQLNGDVMAYLRSTE
jgi:hypothetical protein